MKIAIVGAGSIGGLLGFRLDAAGNDVTLVARGAHLTALRSTGLCLIDEEGGESRRFVRAVERLEPAGYDVIILGLKAHQVSAVAADVAAAAEGDTMIVTAQNGIPWWYFVKHGGALEGTVLQSVDPGGQISRQLPIDRVVGSVVYPAAEIVMPGTIRHIEGNRFSVGELDDADTPRIRALSSALREAGFKAPVLSDIRAEIWTKLWGNLTFNPVSALTRATLEDICRFPPTRMLATRMMEEAQAVAEALGVRFRVSLEKRLAGAEAVGPHKTSMLQDAEAGRPLETEALVGVVAELGRLLSVPTPSIDAIYGATCLLAKSLAAPR